jgi:hypothetical protein
MFVCNHIAIASKHKCIKTNPTHHHDASFSTIANGPLYHWLKGLQLFPKHLFKSLTDMAFPKKKSNYEIKIILKKSSINFQ